MLKFGLGLGINKGRFLFNPFNLNPLLAYEAESSMVAPFEQPTLDLDPSNPSSLDVITATRAGVATYVDAYGLIQTADPNTVRVDHVDGVPMMLIEPSATNLLPYSEDFSDTFYIKDSGVSIGTTNHQSPSGSLNATKIDVSDNGRIYANTALDTYTTSIFIKKGTFSHFRVSGSSIDLNAETTTSGTIEKLNDGWYRVSNTFSTSRPLQIQAYPDATYSVHSVSGDYYIWGIQVETGSVATSYIPTSGSAVTRNADNLVIDGTAFSDAYNQSEGTIYTEFVPRRVDSYQHLYEFSNGNTTNRINVHLQNANARFYLTSGGTNYTNTVAATNVTTGELHRTGFSYKTNDAPASFDGGAEITDTTVTVPSGIDRLYLGAIYNQNDDYCLNGHIKRLIYWPYHSDNL